MWTCFLHWGVYPLALLTWIWEVAFWTVTKCDSLKSGILAVTFRDLSHFVIMAVTAQTESNNTENVFWVEYPCSLLTWIWKVAFFAHFGVISLLYLFLCMYISYKAHNRFTKATFLIVSDVDVNMFPALRSKPSCITDMNLRSCILNRHKMQQSQIATNEESGNCGAYQILNIEGVGLPTQGVSWTHCHYLSNRVQSWLG